MSNVSVDIPHKLGAAEARRKIERGTGRLEGHLPPGSKVQSRWNGDDLDLDITAMGQKLSGRVGVQETLVRVEVTLPPALRFLAPMVESGLRRGGSELLQDKRKT